MWNPPHSGKFKQRTFSSCASELEQEFDIFQHHKFRIYAVGLIRIFVLRWKYFVPNKFPSGKQLLTSHVKIPL